MTIKRRDRANTGGSGDGGIALDWGANGLQVTDYRPKPIWARITGRAGSLYAWTEVNVSDTTFPDGGATIAQNGTAVAGNWPAYEITGSTTVPVNTKLLLWPSPTGSFWLFRYDGASSGLTVEEVDGSPSYTSRTTLRFDQTDGFVVSQPAAGIARVDMSSASATQKGAVDTTTQTFEGQKTFNSLTYFVANELGTVGGLSLETTAGIYCGAAVSCATYVSVVMGVFFTTRQPDASALAGTLYESSDTNKLTYKDIGGTTNVLY